MIIKLPQALLDDLDANTSSSSSTSAADASANANQTDANASGSSTEGQQKTQETQKPTLESVVQDVFDKASQSSSEGEEADSSIKKLNATEEGKEGEGSEKKETDSQTSNDKGEKKEEAELKEGEPVPYERFAQTTAKMRSFEERLTHLEPLAQAQQGVIEFCQRSEISPEQFRDWMEIASLANTEPAKALERLKPMLETMQGVTGDKLPQELQAAVDNGDISLDYAKRLVKAESQTKFGQKRMEQTQQQFVQQRQAEFARNITSTLSTWLDSKKGLDPDFKPKAAESDPHGKYEFWLSELANQARANQQSILQSSDPAKSLVALAEKALSLVNNSLKGMQPRTKPSKVISSTNSASTAPQAPKTVEEAMANAAKKHGISLPVTK